MPSPSPIHEGETIAGYCVEGELGSGGMGIVYRARHLTLGRTVALKFLPLHLATDEVARRRFLREARAASALDHPNLCTVYEVGEHEGRPFIAMACYEGETLERKIARGPLPVEEALDYATQMARGLSGAHEAGIIHRDLKPSNVMVDARGRATLLDFGVARASGEPDLTEVGAVVGTAGYMSPEQTRGETVDQRSDLWALGVVLYEMLTGRRPFQGSYAQAVVYAILHEDPTPIRDARPEVSAGLAAVVEHALAKDRAARYPDAASMLADLDAAQEGSAVRVPLRARTGARKSVRNGAAALLLVAVGVAAYLWWGTEPFGGRTPPNAAPVPSVAVLPFEDLSGDANRDPFSDGLSEDLLQTLARSPGLNVVGRTSSFVFRDTDALSDSIGRALGVAYLVQGSVRRDAGQIRVSAQLIDAETGFEVWSHTYARPIADVFGLQYEIARAVAEHLALAAAVARVQPGTDDPEAYALVQQAEAIRRLGTTGREATGEEAERLYERALDRDPKYAAAWSGLAWARYMQTPDEGDWDRVRVAAQRSLSLDPNDADAHHLLGEVARYRGGGDEAQAHFERAIEADPSDAYLRVTLAELLAERQDPNGARQAADRAVQLGPLDATVWNIAGIVYSRIGQHDRAADAYTTTMTLAPGHPWATAMLSVLHAARGRPSDALPLIERGLAQHPEDVAVRRAAAYVYASNGRRADAERMMSGIQQGYYRAVVETALGDRDAAFAALERSLRAGEYALRELGGVPVDPRLRPLHSDPRWAPLVAHASAGDGS